MILVDTSLWVDRLHRGAALAPLLETGAVLSHPSVIGELALGNLGRREETLSLLHGLPQAAVATDGEVLQLIERRALHGTGIGYIDAHLLAATRLAPDAELWTRDERLGSAAASLGIDVQPA